MKKGIALCLCLLFVFLLFGCGKGEPAQQSGLETEVTQKPAADKTAEPAEETKPEKVVQLSVELFDRANTPQEEGTVDPGGNAQAGSPGEILPYPPFRRNL